MTATANKRTGEKGQRTPHSRDAYGEKGGVKGAAHCQCGALFSDKRWQNGKNASPQLKGTEIVCPACRRISDRNPAGIVHLGGDFYTAHQGEIDHLVDNTALAAAARNPLGRIMDLSRSDDGTTITTTDVKLAQKIGREIFKSHGGELSYNWSHAENPVRVTWRR